MGISQGFQIQDILPLLSMFLSTDSRYLIKVKSFRSASHVSVFKPHYWITETTYYVKPSSLKNRQLFWTVVTEKNWEDQRDRSCKKWRSITKSRGGKTCPT